MTENEAIELLKNNYPKTRKMVDGRLQGGFDDHECDVGIVIDLAINALEEVQQYRAIGTPEELQTMKERGGFTGVELANIAEMQMKLKEYEAIGTPEECREAVEKQTDEKPTAVLGTFGGKEYECKNCGSDVCYGEEYCRWCGQKLDWSDEE